MGKLRQRKEKKLCCDSSSGQGQSQGECINKPLEISALNSSKKEIQICFLTGVKK